jgi:hypothetical protein
MRARARPRHCLHPESLLSFFLIHKSRPELHTKRLPNQVPMQACKGVMQACEACIKTKLEKAHNPTVASLLSLWTVWGTAAAKANRL